MKMGILFPHIPRKKADLSIGFFAYQLFFLVAATAAAVIVIAAIELLVACGAGDLGGVNGLVEVYLLATLGALYLVENLIVVLVAVTAAAIAVIVVAIAVTFVFTVALVENVVNLFFKLAKVVVKLVEVISMGVNLILKGINCVCHIGDKIEHLNDKLCLGLVLIEVKALCKALKVSSLFKYIHNNNSFHSAIMHCSNAVRALRSFEILAGSGVDTDLGADIDEERNLDGRAGLESSGLGCALCGVALEAGLGVGYFKLNEKRRLNVEYVALVGNDLAHFVLLNKLEVVAENLCVDRKLFEALHIHEVVKVAVVVEVLHFLSLNDRVLKLIGGVEGTLGYSACDNVLHLGSYERRTLTGLNMLELNYLKNLSVHFKSDTVLKISGYYHFKNPP